MNPDSLLVLGAAETVIGITEAYKLVEGKRGLYTRGNVQAVVAPSAGLARAAGA